jgi:hypothetical protein
MEDVLPFNEGGYSFTHELFIEKIRFDLDHPTYGLTVANNIQALIADVTI